MVPLIIATVATMALGRPDAPVVMVAYSEFQCPFCGTPARDTQPDLLGQYGEDGTRRIEWRDVPYVANSVREG